MSDVSDIRYDVVAQLRYLISLNEGAGKSGVELTMFDAGLILKLLEQEQ